MQFHKLTINLTMAIAATVALQTATYAQTRYDAIAKQIGLQTAPSRTSQLELQAAIQSTPQAALQSASPTAISAVNQEGQTFFSEPPQLIRVAATQTGAYTPSVYEFTLTVPKNAGQPLKAVTIAQARNVETVKFDVSSSKAFVGDHLTASSEIRLASVGGEQSANPGEVTIVFDQPVQPGNTVTVALAAQRNPVWSGVYEFGVTAYPAGENGLGQFLGYGRINFYGNSN